MVGPEVLVPLGGMAMVLGIAVGVPLARAYARRMEAAPTKQSLNSGEIVTRLDRIEQAVDAMATEIERISEGQRFTTKLLSESRQQQIAAPATHVTPVETRAADKLPDGTVLSPAARRG